MIKPKELSDQDRIWIIRAVELYCKKLEDRADIGKKLGMNKEAGKEDGAADALRCELVEPGPGNLTIYASRHRLPIEKGLGILAANMLAGKSVERGLGLAARAVENQEYADHIKTKLLPLFEDTEQEKLPL